jgi:hypothetical protein
MVMLTDNVPVRIFIDSYAAVTACGHIPSLTLSGPWLLFTF